MSADTDPMNLALYMPTKHVSRYALLGAMGAELAEAFMRAGATLNPAGNVEARAGMYLFLNFPDTYDNFAAWSGIAAGRVPPRCALVQFFVDHPFALNAPFMDRVAQLPHFRLLLPCPDDAHLLRLRWPTLKHLPCRHGVSRAALCDAPTLEASHAGPPRAGARDLGLLVAGSIHDPHELARLKAPIPPALHAAADEMVRFMLEYPLASFGQAFELCTPGGVYASSQWQYLQTLWRYVTAALNRERRVRLVSAMQGIPTTVIGTAAWREFCTGTIRYEGEAAYDALPAWFARAKVSLAWGPTQFVHGYSERLLLALAGGCAAVADDRAAVRRDFGECTARFDAANTESARDAVSRLLADEARRITLAARGRAEVERAHLWDHRLEVFVAALNDAMRSTHAQAA
ncbi:MAG: hypothetical protein HBSAPP03_18590 [Phycisphaerae bacterium]|nr:MAG: hypothetical protein HBSAPP03_18590 [Phycisphaerae bacterium]